MTTREGSKQSLHAHLCRAMFSDSSCTMRTASACRAYRTASRNWPYACVGLRGNSMGMLTSHTSYGACALGFSPQQASSQRHLITKAPLHASEWVEAVESSPLCSYCKRICHRLLSKVAAYLRQVGAAGVPCPDAA